MWATHDESPSHTAQSPPSQSSTSSHDTSAPPHELPTATLNPPPSPVTSSSSLLSSSTNARTAVTTSSSSSSSSSVTTNTTSTATSTTTAAVKSPLPPPPSTSTFNSITTTINNNNNMPSPSSPQQQRSSAHSPTSMLISPSPPPQPSSPSSSSSSSAVAATTITAAAAASIAVSATAATSPPPSASLSLSSSSSSSSPPPPSTDIETTIITAAVAAADTTVTTTTFLKPMTTHNNYNININNISDSTTNTSATNINTTTNNLTNHNITADTSTNIMSHNITANTNTNNINTTTQTAAATTTTDTAASSQCNGGSSSGSTSNSASTGQARATLKSILSRPRYKLITEGEIQVCRLNHTRTIVSKIMNSKYLRRWESHHLVLSPAEIRSATPTGFMNHSLPYSSIEDIHIISRWDAGHKFCIRITIQDGSLLLQAGSSYLRDQWLQSIIWKKHVYKYEKLLKHARRPEVVVKEIKNLIDVSLSTPIQDSNVYQFPLDLISELLHTVNCDLISKSAHENIIIALIPLLENNHPTQEICEFFSQHCKKNPRSSIIIDLFTPVAQRILKHNMDFGKFPQMRKFIQEYIQALNSQNDGFKVVQNFVKNMHGQSSTCPHPRVLPNLIAVCLASIYSCYDEKKKGLLNNTDCCEEDWNRKLLCYVHMFEAMTPYDDWRCILGSLLQPVPFPTDAIGHSFFTTRMKTIITQIALDPSCNTHQTVLSIRENKEGWFNLYCPGNICCDDDGELWGIMLNTLIGCCCKRKTFLLELSKSVNPVMLLALRGREAAMEALCGMLEMDIIESNDLKMQIITTLQTTAIGKKMYTALCERQIALRELQKGGPKKLTLPPQSTDADLVKMLSAGSFGNLECLSLAFTQVTSACAPELIKLPSLRSLNLWSTQFGDAGLQLISEHLVRLQVLNLCETPVTDKGLICLAALKNLRKLNLNSTCLSALTFEGLKEKLPSLQECDVRYTEAW